MTARASEAATAFEARLLKLTTQIAHERERSKALEKQLNDLSSKIEAQQQTKEQVTEQELKTLETELTAETRRLHGLVSLREDLRMLTGDREEVISELEATEI